LGAAYLAGFEQALDRRYDVVVEMDADGSHRPQDLPALLAAVDRADVVLGSRYVPGGRLVGWSRSRELLSRVGNAYARRALGLAVRDATGGFRAYRSTVLEKVLTDPVDSQGYCFQIDVLRRAVAAGFTVAEVPITFVERAAGTSKMDLSAGPGHRLPAARARVHGAHRLTPPAWASTSTEETVLTPLDELDAAAGTASVAADPRLRHVWDLVRSPAVVALSLDVFDTVLWRAVPEPTDAFLILGNRLRDRELLPPDVTPLSFRRLRVLAEASARQAAELARDSTECRLTEIYAQLAHVCTRADWDRYIEEELSVEYDLCRVDLGVAALMAKVSGELGKQVRLVSDTYLSEQQLRALLRRPELAAVQLSSVSVSSEFGVGKSAGLFAASLAGSRLAPSSIVHIGDHPVADVAAARAAGLTAVHYEKGDPQLTAALRAERALDAVAEPSLSLHPYSGDHGLTGLRARAVRLAEVDRVPDSMREHWVAGAAVFGPAFTGFGSWVQERAAAAGAAKVLCLMREGEFLSEVVTAAGLTAEAPVPSEPLWLSRQTCALAAVFTGSEEELRSFLARRKPTTVAGLFAQIGADLHLLPALDAIAGAPLDAPDVHDRVLAAVRGEPRVRAQIVLRAQRAREHLYTHLDRHLPGDGPVVLVDVGWGGTIQSLLSRLLDERSTPREVIGLYLATNGRADGHRLRGFRAEGYLAQGGSPVDLLGPVLRSPEILEQICMSDAGTLLGFGPSGELVTAPERMPRRQVAQKLAVQHGIRAFQDLWSSYVTTAPWVFDLSGPEARRALLLSITRLMASPTTEEALAFGAWAHDDNFGTSSSDLIVDEHTLEAARFLSPRGLGELTMREAYWPAGAARLASTALSAVFAATLTSRLDADEASPLAETRDFTVYVDEGADFHRGPKAIVTARGGASGATMVRASLPVSGARRVRVDPPGQRFLLRLDWLRISLHTSDQAEPVVVDVRAFTEPHVGLMGMRWAGPGVVEVTTGDPVIAVDIAALHPALAARVHRVDIELALASLRVPQGLTVSEEAPPEALPAAPAPPWTAARLARGVARRLRARA